MLLAFRHVRPRLYEIVQGELWVLTNHGHAEPLAGHSFF